MFARLWRVPRPRYSGAASASPRGLEPSECRGQAAARSGGPRRRRGHADRCESARETDHGRELGQARRAWLQYSPKSGAMTTTRIVDCGQTVVWGAANVTCVFWRLGWPASAGVFRWSALSVILDRWLVSFCGAAGLSLHDLGDTARPRCLLHDHPGVVQRTRRPCNAARGRATCRGVFGRGDERLVGARLPARAARGTSSRLKPGPAASGRRACAVPAVRPVRRA